MAHVNGKELLIAMMNEEIRKQKLEKYGSIAFCEERNVLCFGCLTENGECKYKICLHDDPKWIEQQKRIEEKRKAAMKPQIVEPEPTKPTVEKVDVEAERRKIRNLEAKARGLYMAGERKEADRVFNKAKKARKQLWEKQQKEEVENGKH